MSKRRVKDLMTTEIMTLGRNHTLALGDELMNQARVRHMPVLNDDGELCGIISQRDLYRSALVRALGFGSVAEKRMLEGVLVKEVMTTDVVTTTPDTELSEAATVMLDRKIGCLPVVEGNELVGILTEADFVKLAVS